jgi:hypothetical protein
MMAKKPQDRPMAAEVAAITTPGDFRGSGCSRICHSGRFNSRDGLAGACPKVRDRAIQFDGGVHLDLTVEAFGLDPKQDCHAMGGYVGAGDPAVGGLVFWLFQLKHPPRQDRRTVSRLFQRPGKLRNWPPVSFVPSRIGTDVPGFSWKGKWM